MEGLEPTSLTALDPKSSASTNSATLPTQQTSVLFEKINIMTIHRKAI